MDAWQAEGRVNPTECSAALLELQAMVGKSYFSHRSQELAYLADHVPTMDNWNIGLFGGDIDGFDPTDRSATSNRKLLWPNGKVYYTIAYELSKFKINNKSKYSYNYNVGCI
ncbi:hypothetical protein GQR58_019514 [Nymphon striatum]|nr:hypothetical protein GQR58_019514 [Nymphon striatum]